MPIVQFDPTEIPPWRRRPRRSEVPLRAFRGWHLRYDILSPDERERGELLELDGELEKRMFEDAYLGSLAIATVWEGPVIKAHMKPVDMEIWDKTENSEVWRSGIYAVKTEEIIQCMVLPIYRSQVWGAVDLWGQIAEHEQGYRAEYCMVVGPLRLVLDFLDDNEKMRIEVIRDSLMKRYQCDVDVDIRSK